jgi:hypothetical protein
MNSLKVAFRAIDVTTTGNGGKVSSTPRSEETPVILKRKEDETYYSKGCYHEVLNGPDGGPCMDKFSFCADGRIDGKGSNRDNNENAWKSCFG